MICLFEQRTAYGWRIRDWSSDCCSSDLEEGYVRLVFGDRLDRAAAVVAGRDDRQLRPCLAQQRLERAAQDLLVLGDDAGRGGAGVGVSRHGRGPGWCLPAA